MMHGGTSFVGTGKERFGDQLFAGFLVPTTKCIYLCWTSLDGCHAEGPLCVQDIECKGPQSTRSWCLQREPFTCEAHLSTQRFLPPFVCKILINGFPFLRVSRMLFPTRLHSFSIIIQHSKRRVTYFTCKQLEFWLDCFKV